MGRNGRDPTEVFERGCGGVGRSGSGSARVTFKEKKNTSVLLFEFVPRPPIADELDPYLLTVPKYTWGTKG
jgi:hypothetical protein